LNRARRSGSRRKASGRTSATSRFSLVSRARYHAAEEYPKSPNVYDRLGDAYEKNGQPELAIESYRKAVEIDPKHEHATERVKALTAAQRPK